MSNKKAFFFTMIVIVILGLFFASFSLYDEVKDRKSIQKRVETMNGFMSSVEKDLSRKLYISTYRVIFLAESQIISDGTYVSNLDSFFSDAFIKGKVGSDSNVLALQGYNLSAIIKDIKEDSSLVGADFTIDENNVGIVISQDDPWNIKTTLILNMTLTDQSGLALINKTNTLVSAYVPITNFEDPVYFIGTSKAVTNLIIKSPYENQFSSSNLTNLIKHSNSSYYVANPSAPSFLKRLKGDFSNDSNGIESFVNTQSLSSKSISIDSGKSVIDYIYFDASSDPPYYTITGMPSWFKIDNSSSVGRLSLYNVTSLKNGPF